MRNVARDKTCSSSNCSEQHLRPMGFSISCTTVQLLSITFEFIDSWRETCWILNSWGQRTPSWNCEFNSCRIRKGTIYSGSFKQRGLASSHLVYLQLTLMSAILARYRALLFAAPKWNYFPIPTFHARQQNIYTFSPSPLNNPCEC